MRSSSRAEPWLRIGTLLCSGWFTSSLLAQSENPGLRVVLSAPAGGDCIDEAELAVRVAERLGRRTVSAGDSAEQVNVVLTRSEAKPGWSAALSARAGRGAPRERRIDTTSAFCRDLDDALVLVLAALVGVARPGEAIEAEAEREPAPAPPPEPPHGPAASPEPHPSAENGAFNTERRARARVARHVAYPFYWSVAAAAALSTGRLPGLSWGASVALQGEWRRLTLLLGALALPAVRADLGAGAEARFTSAAGLLRVCGSVLTGRWLRAALCLGATSGAVYTRTHRLARNAATWSPATDGELGLRISGLVAWKVRWLVQVSGALPLTRTRFVFDESGGERRVYHRARAGVLLEVGGIVGGSS